MKNQEMESIIKVALATKFETSQIEVLMEIILNTPNPIIATHKLLGIYIAPVINLECHPDVHKQELDKKFIAYNEWKDEVDYEYTSFIDSDEFDHAGNPIKRAKTYYRVMSLKRWNTGSW